jgi:hypothetical protein
VGGRSKLLGLEATFAVSEVLRGDYTNRTIVLHYYRWETPFKTFDPLSASGTDVNSPALIFLTPTDTNKFLLYLVGDGPTRYAPASGQLDSARQAVVSQKGKLRAHAQAPRPRPETDHANWVESCLRDFQYVQVGMTRGEIESKLSKDGGLQSVSPIRFVHPSCAYFKVDVAFDFKRDAADQNRAIEGKDDKCTRVSKPYIERPFLD